MSLEELYLEYKSQDAVCSFDGMHNDAHYDTEHIQEYIDEP